MIRSRRQCDYAIALISTALSNSAGEAWATLALDYAENVACGVLVATFPLESAAVASLAGILTAFKFAGYAACVVALAFTAWESIGKRRRAAG